MQSFIANRDGFLSVNWSSTACKALCAAAVIYWLLYLDRTSFFYVSYLVVGTIAIILLCAHTKSAERLNGASKVMLALLAAFLSACTIFGNYSLFPDPETQIDNYYWLANVLRAILFVLSNLITYAVIAYRGYAIFLLHVVDAKSMREDNHPGLNKLPVRKCFLFSWIFISAVYITLFFLSYYPGVLTPDSLDQVSQILNGNYSNHHPFWHTQIIRLAMRVGFALFGEINAAIATFSVFQCVTMAAIFSFSVSTMFQIGAKRWVLILTVALFAFLPFHWSYAFTMWKDVLFGGSVLVFVCSFYRMRNAIGNKTVSMVLLFISSMGFCLLRSNGPIVFALLMTIVVVMGFFNHGRFFPNYRIVCAEMGVSLFLSFIMLGPALNMMNVAPVDRIESLSIPAQQIARVVASDRELTAEEQDILNRAIDQNRIADRYVPYLSDPIKDLVRLHGGNDAINENPVDFIRLYLSLGLKYPLDYFFAWIDQTVGYWNSGYPYWSTYPYWNEASSIVDNEFGIVQTPASEHIHEAVRHTERLSLEENRQSAIGVIYCTGLWIQVLICLTVFNFLARRKNFVEPFAIFGIILTLLIATPVAAEFRYIYSLYTCLPFLLYILTRRGSIAMGPSSRG